MYLGNLHQLVFSQVLLALPALSYVPATPRNVSQGHSLGSNNNTQLLVQWSQSSQNGSFLTSVSYQLARYGINAWSRGALVHFSEDIASEATPPTDSPWIAMIACDANATRSNQKTSIFSLARDKGAQAALLYSLYSGTCVINPAYTDTSPNNHDIDVYSTESSTSARIIESRFGQTGSNEYNSYDSQLLNASALAIITSITEGSPTGTGYLIASLGVPNVTDTGNDSKTLSASARNKANARGLPPLPCIIVVMILPWLARFSA